MTPRRLKKQPPLLDSSPSLVASVSVSRESAEAIKPGFRLFWRAELRNEAF
jgi:hypothetical protein